MSLPLAGVRILDLTRMLAGPYGTLLLVDLGADVIKVEDPDGGDATRLIPPHYPSGESSYFLAANRGKRSVALDTSTPDGRALLDRLVAVSDAVVDNFRPGARERLGLTPERLRAVRPDLICVSLSSFGSDVPDRDAPTFDLVLQALGGGMSITGEPGRAPVRAGIPIGDLAGGMFLAMAVLAGLVQRGRGEATAPIDLSLLDCQAHLLTYIAQATLLTGKVPGPVGSGHVSVVPYQAFPTADGWITVGIFVEHFFAKLCGCLGRPELARDPRFVNNAERVKHREALVPLLEAAFRAKPTAHWTRALADAGVPAGPIQDVAQVLRDPRLRARDMVTPVVHSTVGPVETLGSAFRTVPPGPPPTVPAPTLGQHTREVLGGLCGVSEADLARLAAANVVRLG